jgi:hypothetical protein
METYSAQYISQRYAVSGAFPYATAVAMLQAERGKVVSRDNWSVGLDEVVEDGSFHARLSVQWQGEGKKALPSILKECLREGKFVRIK